MAKVAEKKTFASLKEKLMKNGTIKETSVINKSKIYGNKDVIPTYVPIINCAFSGRLDGGLEAGLTQITGNSRHFKTGFALLAAKAFQTKYPDGIVLFYDSEFGSPPEYFASFGLNLENIVHTPITNVEELKFDLVQQLEGLERSDKLLILIDSIGNLASKKELEDAKEGNSAADMSRAKAIKSLWRIVTPYLTMKDIPLIAINHIYMTQEMYAKAVVSGGTGNMLSSDTVWIIGKRQDKDGKVLVGNEFVINIEKSRKVKEKSQFVVTVGFDNGIDKYSGLLDIAEELKYIAKSQPGYYKHVDQETGELVGDRVNASDTSTKEFWGPILKNPKFQDAVENKFKLTALKTDDDEASEPAPTNAVDED